MEGNMQRSATLVLLILVIAVSLIGTWAVLDRASYLESTQKGSSSATGLSSESPAQKADGQTEAGSKASVSLTIKNPKKR